MSEQFARTYIVKLSAQIRRLEYEGEFLVAACLKIQIECIKEAMSDLGHKI